MKRKVVKEEKGRRTSGLNDFDFSCVVLPPEVVDIIHAQLVSAPDYITFMVRLCFAEAHDSYYLLELAFDLFEVLAFDAELRICYGFLGSMS